MSIARLKVIRVIVELEGVEERMGRIERLARRVGDRQVEEAMREARASVKRVIGELKSRLGMSHL